MHASVTQANSIEAIPIREGIYRKGDAGEPARLLASKCRETGQVFWPPERINPITGKAGTLDEVEISGNGRVHAFTVVARGLPGFASPYALASIDLDAGPTLLAQLTDWREVNVGPGTRVQLVIGIIKTQKNGPDVQGPMFRPVADGAHA